MDGSVQIVDLAQATFSLHFWFGNPFPFLDRHVQVVLYFVDLLHGLITDPSLGICHRKRLPENLSVLAFYKLSFSSFSSTYLLG